MCVWYITMMHMIYYIGYIIYMNVYMLSHFYIIHIIYVIQPWIGEENKYIYWLNDPNHCKTSCPKARSLLWHLSCFRSQIFLVINILVLWIQIHKASDDPPKIGITAYWHSQQFLPHLHMERYLGHGACFSTHPPRLIEMLLTENIYKYNLYNMIIW